MALFIRQNEPQSQLRTKVSADLQERTRSTAAPGEPNDDSRDALLLKDQHQTKPYGLLIGLAVGIVIIVALFFWLKT